MSNCLLYRLLTAIFVSPTVCACKRWVALEIILRMLGHGRKSRMDLLGICNTTGGSSTQHVRVVTRDVRSVASCITLMSFAAQCIPPTLIHQLQIGTVYQAPAISMGADNTTSLSFIFVNQIASPTLNVCFV